MEMPAVNPLITQLQEIANHPTTFPMSYTYRWEVKKALLITGIALAILSITVWKEATAVSYGTLLLGTAFMIKAVWPKQVANVQPVVDMLMQLYEEKKRILNDKIRGVEVENFEAASKCVEQADLAYEGDKQSEDEYADIVHASETIAAWDEEKTLERLNPEARLALKQVQQAVNRFLYGDTIFIGSKRSTTLGENWYIRYLFHDGKIVVDI
jgi:hypothetical protein